MTESAKTEVEILREKLTALGVSYAPAAKEAALRKLLEEAEAGTLDQRTDDQKSRDEQLKLVRVIVRPIDPNKKEFGGEIITVSNSLIGTVSKYVPFDNEEGWHIPKAMYDTMKEMKFQAITQERNDKGQYLPKMRTISAYVIEVLEPLDEADLKALAAAQSARDTVGKD